MTRNTRRREQDSCAGVRETADRTGNGLPRRSERKEAGRDAAEVRTAGNLEDGNSQRIRRDPEEAVRKKADNSPGTERNRRRTKSRGTKQLERHWSSRYTV